MPRVRLSSVYVLCPLLLLRTMFWIEPVNADCWYNNNRYGEGNQVATGEPCLNCTCNRGTPVCYLRVCPRLPNPPPQGCILLHRYRTCCPELICEDRPLLGNRIEARSDQNEFDTYDSSILKNACVANGSIYGPGSAMDSSSFCEYCYCLGGQQRCIKPKCLLPVEGCSPMYNSNSCCPMHYNCTDIGLPISTTTSAPKVMHVNCWVSDKYYPEGGKILGVGHSACDNCYCIRGLIRCEPLSCAPPLLGCLPVIKPGQCCAASYNCSGTIETRPEPNYGNFPVVSKEYAKLRKEVQKFATNKWGNATKNKSKDTGAYYVTAESPNVSTAKIHRIPGLSGTTRHFAGFVLNASTTRPSNSMYDVNLNLKEIKVGTTDRGEDEIVYKNKYRPPKTNDTFSGTYYATANYEFQSATIFIASTTNGPKDKDSTSYEMHATTEPGFKTPKQNNTSTANDYLLDGRFYKKIDTRNQIYIPDEDLISTTDVTTKTTTNTDTTILEFTKNEDVAQSTEQSTTTNNSYFFSENNETDFMTTHALILDATNISDSTLQLNTVSQGLIKQTVNDYEDVAATKFQDDIVTDDSVNDVISNTVGYTTTDITSLENVKDPVTLKTVINSTDCKDNEKLNLVSVELKKPEETRLVEKLEPKRATNLNSNDITVLPEDVTIVDLESKVKVSTVTLHPFQKLSPGIISLTKDKDAYFDYDFKPTLPPSLPNLRIIPFLPSDALDSTKTLPDKKVGYQLVDERITDPSIYTFTNLFSPPIETEGGFVPKEPPPLNNLFDKNFHTTAVELNAVTSIPVPPITNQDKMDANNCLSENREIAHGESVTLKDICLTCICYYGEIECQEVQCSLPNPECHTKSTNILEWSHCCQRMECDEKEAPTVVLDRANVTSSPRDVITVVEGVGHPDPFKDVIRTEPAPNLQMLMGDMKPFFIRNTTEKLTNFTTTQITDDSYNNSYKKNIVESKPDEKETVASLDDVLKFLFKDVLENTTKSNIEMTSVPLPTTYPQIPSSTNKDMKEDIINRTELRENKTDSSIRSTSNELTPAVGLLKLAGCNIYGRMYRVGKIISELSGPCLECKCTDIGVQCTPIC